MSASIAIAVHGASGRMGRAVLGLLEGDAELRLVAALVRPAVAHAQRVATGDPAATPALASTSALPEGAVPRVLVDFSTAAAFDAALALAVRSRAAFVSGTTGLDAGQREALAAAAAIIPVLWSANFCLGVAVLARLVREAASALPDWDCEILETHHRRKRDAPSGTALALGEDVAAARGQVFDSVARRSRDDVDSPRVPGEIGFASLRAGDVVGEHSVLFAIDGERIELTHRASDRVVFARGALVAARWIVDQPAGRYTLADVVDAARRR